MPVYVRRHVRKTPAPRALSPHKFLYRRYPVISDAIQRKLFGLIRKSIKENREIGASLCGTLDDIELGDICVGEACTVLIEKCPPIVGELGTFHTHPHVKPIISSDDVLYAAQNKEQVFIIGGNDKAPLLTASGSPEERAAPKNLVLRIYVAAGDISDLSKKIREFPSREEIQIQAELAYKEAGGKRPVLDRELWANTGHKVYEKYNKESAELQKQAEKAYHVARVIREEEV